MLLTSPQPCRCPTSWSAFGSRQHHLCWKRSQAPPPLLGTVRKPHEPHQKLDVGSASPKPSSPLPPTSWGGWQPPGLSAEVAAVSLEPVAWGWCSPDEEVPRRHLAVRKMLCVHTTSMCCIQGLPPARWCLAPCRCHVQATSRWTSSVRAGESISNRQREHSPPSPWVKTRGRHAFPLPEGASAASFTCT